MGKREKLHFEPKECVECGREFMPFMSSQVTCKHNGRQCYENRRKKATREYLRERKAEEKKRILEARKPCKVITTAGEFEKIWANDLTSRVEIQSVLHQIRKQLNRTIELAPRIIKTKYHTNGRSIICAKIGLDEMVELTNFFARYYYNTQHNTVMGSYKRYRGLTYKLADMVGAELNESIAS